MAREQLTFVKIEVESLTDEQQIMWHDLLKAKQAFKASLQAMAPDGCSVQFSDKYGELKIAVARVAKPKPQAQSLAAFLQQQSANGRSV